MSGSRARSLRLTARRSLFELKTLIAPYPGIALPIARARHGVPVSDRTEIVIEGFPRTGSSFAVAAFVRAQGRHVDVACHVHAPAQVVGGVRRGLPVLVVVRAPEDTTLSFVIRNPDLTLEQAMRAYRRFYEPIVRRVAEVVVADFEQVTTDLGRVIARVNTRFGTSFLPFRHDEDSVRAVFDEIDRDYAQRFAGERFDRSVARPSPARESLKQQLRTGYRAEALADARIRADRTYDLLKEAAGAP